MAEPHDDEREASRAYRGLPREEPPDRVDGAIRAAARRAADSRPLPLVAPTGRGRWYFPVAAAAVVVLAVAVTSQVEREQAEPAQATASQAKEENIAPGIREAQKPERRLGAQVAPRPSREDFSRDRLARNEGLARNEAPRAQAAPAGPPAAAQSPMEAKPALTKKVSPDAELERIAGLRRQGRDEEADRALAEFRKRYPDYRIAPEMLKKVEKN